MRQRFFCWFLPPFQTEHNYYFSYSLWVSTLRLFTEPNPIGLNTMLAMLDCAEPVFRLPYIQYDEELRAQGAALIRGIGLEHTPGSKLLDLRNSDFTTLSEWWPIVLSCGIVFSTRSYILKKNSRAVTKVWMSFHQTKYVFFVSK